MIRIRGHARALIAVLSVSVLGLSSACTPSTGGASRPPSAVTTPEATTAATVAPAPTSAAKVAVSATPTRAVLTPTATPATAQYVSWRTRGAFAHQRVLVRPVAGGGAWQTVAAARRAATQKKYSGSTWPEYTVTLGALRPGTAYEYRIVNDSGRSALRRFTTASPTSGTFSMLAFGDTQIDNASKVKPIISRAVRARPNARLMLQVGDVVNDPRRDKEWSGLFTGMGESRREKNWVISIGNHEQCKLISCDSNRAEGFRTYFRWPRNGYPKQGPTWYYTDYQGVRVIALDTFGGQLSTQMAFLDRALATNPGQWSIVVLHAGPFATRPGRTQPDIRTKLVKIAERRNVDLVLSGHDHSYARGYRTSRPNGTVYAVSDSGPKFYDAGSTDWTSHGARIVRQAKRVSTFQTIDVTPTSLRYRAVVALKGKGATSKKKVGQTLDSLTITKTKGTKRVAW